MAITTPKEIRPGDVIVYFDDYPVLRAQRVDISPNFGNQELSEIGSSNIVESVPETITSQVSVETNGVGGVDVFQKLMGEKASDPYTSGGNDGVLTQDDFENAIVDFACAIQEEGTLRRTVYVPNCYLTGFDFNFSVDGVHTENYTFLGDVDYDCLSNYADTRIAIGGYSALTGVSGFVISGYTLETGYAGLQASTGGIIRASTTDITLTNSGSDTWVQWPAATYSGVASADRCRLLYYKSTPDTYATKQSAAGLAGTGRAGVFGRQVEIFLGSGITGAASEKALRVQSVGINGDLSREELEELGNNRVVNKRLNTPLRLNLTVEVAEHDLEMYARLIGGTTWTNFQDYKNNEASENLLLSSSDVTTDSTLIVKVYKERGDTHTTQLEQITMSGLYLTSKSREVSSTSRGTMSFGLQGSYITISGTGEDPY